MVHRNTLPGRCIQRLSERQPSHNTKDAREALTELVFEQLQAPAYYLANQTVLSAFASGKGTALILDIGASHATATPVLDGFVLRKGIHRQPIGGSAITRALQWSISQPSALPNSPRLSPHHAIDIIPPYLIKSKTAVEAGSAPNYLLRQDRLSASHPSYRAYHDFRSLTDFKEAIAAVLGQERGARNPERAHTLPYRRIRRLPPHGHPRDCRHTHRRLGQTLGRRWRRLSSLRRALGLLLHQRRRLDR
ncbi:unnamed protein product, partial [Tilletia caries]